MSERASDGAVDPIDRPSAFPPRPNALARRLGEPNKEMIGDLRNERSAIGGPDILPTRA